MARRHFRTKAGLVLGVGGLVLAARYLQRRRAFDLNDRVVLITGGSRGLGLVLARRFAARGARLILLAREPAELARAQIELEAAGAEVCTLHCDVSDPLQVEGTLRAIEDTVGGVDVLVNNAGVIQVGPMESMTVADYREAMNTHFEGPLRLILGLLPEMKRRGAGRIVNIVSIGGKVSVPHLLPYSASKFALAGLSEGLRAALASGPVRVTTVFPGLMRTGSPRNALFKGHHRAEYAWFSIGDSLPGLSMSAERAARHIVRACENGEPELVLSWPARAATFFHALFPGLTARLSSVVNRLLPGPTVGDDHPVRGASSESWLSPSLLTALTDAAARRNNQLGKVRGVDTPA